MVSTIEVHRSSLSQTLPKIEGENIGNHPIVVDLFKGFANIRPRMHKNPSKWSVDQVLNEMKSWGPNKQLSLKIISKKLVMLLALSSASRCSELAYLDINYMFQLPNGIKFNLNVHKKNRNSAILPGVVFFPSNPEDKILCPVDCLKEYIDRTKLMRKNDSRLIRGIIKPHDKITPPTISRWLTKIIAMSGGPQLNPKTRIGHSVRGAATSKGRDSGLSTADILKAGEWKSESVFRKHYYQQNFTPAFGKSVLSQGVEQVNKK